MSDMAMNDSSIYENKDRLQEEATQPVPGPGAQLAARRQALNWSIEHVATQLNLAPRQIQAIEADNYAALPGIASARGFARSYAKLLNVDPAPLLLVIEGETTGSDELLLLLRRALSTTPFSESRLSSTHRNGLSSTLVRVVLLLVIVVAGVVIGQKAGWFSVLPEAVSQKIDKELPLLFLPAKSTAAVAVPGALETNKVNNLKDLNQDAIASNNVVAPDPSGLSNDSSMAAGNAVISAPTPVELRVRTASAAASSAAGSVSDTKDSLLLTVRENSWIEIKRSDNSTPVARLAKAGETEIYKITGPVLLTIGNASGVDATLRGVPIALQAEAKNNVAHLRLK